MSRRSFIFYWTFISVLAVLALIAVLVISSIDVQALGNSQGNAFQVTPPAPTIIVSTVVVTSIPPMTIVPPTVVIPSTGGDTVFIDFFSGWALWGVLGVLLIVLLIALVARPGDHHHHDL